MKKLIVLFIALILLLLACNNGLIIKSHHNLLGPTVYELTDGNHSIKYYNGQCCCIAKKVLEEIKQQIEDNELSWQDMKNKEFADKYLQQICNELKSDDGIKRSAVANI